MPKPRKAASNVTGRKRKKPKTKGRHAFKGKPKNARHRKPA